MKLVKLSLVAALAVGSMSVLEAKPLEEAIKNVDVSGALRYRFEQSSASKKDYNPGDIGGYIGETNAPHKFRAFVGTKIDAGDGFKLFGQLMYNNDKNGGWAKGTSTVADQGLTTTKQEVVLKQAYLQYDLADAGVSVLFGKQQLGTIWTADFTGMAAKVLITPTQGLTIAAFGVDSFEGTQDGDAFNPGAAFVPLTDNSGNPLTGNDLTIAQNNQKAVNGYIYSKNMYGAAVLANFAGLDAQVWGAYWDKIATLYAVNLKYTLGLGGGNNAGVKVTYLGNAMSSDLKDKYQLNDDLGNGNLVDGRLFGKFSGLDARVGGIFFGDKKKATINTLEDVTGPDLYIGREMFFASRTALVNSLGQSVFGYVGVGYTLPGDVRIGLQGVFGQNTIDAGADDIKDTRMEGVFELGWKANKNLSFEGYYSYINSKFKNQTYTSKTKADGTTDTSDSLGRHAVRLQALYKF